MSLAFIDVPNCSFHWDIHHPFTPWRLLLAYFNHGSRDLTQWKVMIEPLKRRMNRWSFAVYLEFQYRFSERQEITADRVRIGVFLRNRCVVEKDVRNVLFCFRNRFTLEFKGVAEANWPQEQELLVIKVMLDLPGEPAENPLIHGVDSDLKWLSDDLRQLFINRVHSDITLQTSDGLSVPVHTCILEARCEFFLQLYPFSDVVDVEISSETLRDILIYLYSGEVEFGFPKHQNERYIVELYYMIHQFRLDHLRKVFLKRQMQQRRVSGRTVISSYFSIAIPFSAFMIQQCLNQNTPYEFIFTMQIENNNGLWLSYSLKSKSEIQVYVQVNFDLRESIRTGGLDFPFYGQITHINHRDFTIQPNGFAVASNVLFLGCPETFGNPAIHPDQKELLCTLKFTDGITNDEIKSEVIDTIDHEEMQRFNILADHLFRLFNSDFSPSSDLQIVNPDVRTLSHQAIMEARVPKWERAFQRPEEDGLVPREEIWYLDSRALPYVLQYIYTGQSLPVPNHLFNDIQHFATTGESLSLLNYIMRIRSEPETDWYD